jgi:hypothetical protein
MSIKLILIQLKFAKQRYKAPEIGLHKNVIFIGSKEGVLGVKMAVVLVLQKIKQTIRKCFSGVRPIVPAVFFHAHERHAFVNVPDLSL